MTLPARVSRVDTPCRGVVALSLTAGPERAVLLVSARPSAPGVGLVTDRPQGDAAGPFTTLLRGKLVGARLVALASAGRASLLDFDTKDGRLTLLASPEGPDGAITLSDEAGRVHVSAGRSGGLKSEPVPLAWEALWRRGAALGESLEGGGLARKKLALRRTLTALRRKLERKRAAIEADAARALDAPGLRADAALILSSMHAIAPGASEVEVTDYALDPPQARTLPIDPALGPARTADALYLRARKLERGAQIARERAAKVDDELLALLAREEALEAAEDEAALESLEAPTRAPSSGKRVVGRRPYRAFTSSDGLTILVGRSAADNDELTLRHSRPEDLWLHARGTSGSHVVVKLARGQDCPSATLADAATLAAHFSRFRADKDVEVQYTPRRYVRKRRGAPAGSVTLDRERVILVTMEPSRITRLLESERRG